MLIGPHVATGASEEAILRRGTAEDMRHKVVIQQVRFALELRLFDRTKIKIES